MRPLLSALPVLVAIVGCGGVVQVSASGGTGGAKEITGAGGAGGSGTTVTASSSTTSTSSTGGSVAAGTGGSSMGTGGLGGATAGCGMPSPGSGDFPGTVQAGSGARTYVVHVPPSYDASTPMPLVLVLHGFTQTDTGIEAQTEMDPVSDAHGFLAVYPQGLGDSWNAGACCGTSSLSGVDDVQFIRALVTQLETQLCVDPRRVFSSGFSNGGMLSHRLACEMSDVIAAIGAVSGTLAISICTPVRPVPVLHIHGTGDIVVAYENGGVSGAEGVPQTIATWVGIDGCTDATPTTVYEKGDATCTEYLSCKAGTDVELCTIDDGGHQWPGGQNDFIGNLSTDLDASETIAEFFEAHPMP